MSWKTAIYLVCVIVGLVLKISRLTLKSLALHLLICLSLVIGYLLCRLIIAAYYCRELLLLSADSQRKFVGRPLLFPAKLSHARRFPDTERYNYWYDYHMIGIPVGLRGRIGNLLSIDNMPASETCWEKCWFTIDPTYYLDPGSGGRSLEEKLHIFLKSVGENPRSYPYAYLISVPRFLWWQKSAITYWYLYSPDRELSAMIMEINNSFYEKRNVFFRLTGDQISFDHPISTESETNMTALTRKSYERVALHFLSSVPKSRNYKGSWEKLIFGSPFEKVGGIMKAKFVDPIAGSSLQSILSSNTPEGQVKVTSRLSSWGEPVDPLSSPPWRIARFIACWTHVGVLSTYRIVKEALRIRFRGNLEYLQKPEVRPGSIPRKETEIERALELFFREYLSQLAAHSSYPISIRYRPPRSVHFDDIIFDSPATPTPNPRPILTIQPLTPRFYTSFPQYRDSESGFAAALTPSPTNSDQLSCRLSVSDLSLMNQLLSTAAQSLDAELREGKSRSRPLGSWGTHAVYRTVISYLRGTSTETFIDQFVYHFLSPSMQRKYQTNTIRYLLATKLPVESQAVVALLYISAQMIMVYILLRFLRATFVWEDVVGQAYGSFLTPTIGAIVYGGWELVENFIGKYYINPFAWGEGL